MKRYEQLYKEKKHPNEETRTVWAYLRTAAILKMVLLICLGHGSSNSIKFDAIKFDADANFNTKTRHAKNQNFANII